MSQSVQGLTVPGWSDEITSDRQQINGLTLHQVKLGQQDAPMVILLHGFADFWWGWRRQVGHLASAGFQVVVPDQRGVNLSDKPISFKAYDLDTLAADIIAIAESYGREKFSLIGHDFGGLIAWWTAMRYPDRVERLASINAFHPKVLLPYIKSHPGQMLRCLYMGLFQIPVLPESLLRMQNFVILRSLYHLGGRKGTLSPSDIKTYTKIWSTPGMLTGAINWYRALRRMPKAMDPRVRVPTLMIWGVRDRYLDKGLAEKSLELCDQGEALWFEDGTHFVHLEETDAVNTALVKFLKQPSQTSLLPASAA